MDKITVIYTPDTKQNPYARKIEVSEEMSPEAHICNYHDFFKRVCVMLTYSPETVEKYFGETCTDFDD